MPFATTFSATAPYNAMFTQSETFKTSLVANSASVASYNALIDLPLLNGVKVQGEKQSADYQLLHESNLALPLTNEDIENVLAQLK